MKNDLCKFWLSANLARLDFYALGMLPSLTLIISWLPNLDSKPGLKLSFSIDWSFILVLKAKFLFGKESLWLRMPSLLPIGSNDCIAADCFEVNGGFFNGGS